MDGTLADPERPTRTGAVPMARQRSNSTSDHPERTLPSASPPALLRPRGRPARLLAAPDRGQPGLDLRRALHRVDVEEVGGDRLDVPAVAERRAQLVRANAPRSPRPWLPIAEAHEVVSAGRPQHRREAGDVPGPVVVVEYVEHPAIDHGVDREAEAAEVEGVCDLEPRGQPPPGRFLARPRDRGRRDVDTGDIGPTA